MSVPLLPTGGLNEQTHRLLIAETINQILKGRANNVGAFTITANATTTQVSDNLFESAMVPVFVPTTANAAAALSTTYVSARANGSFTVTHANNAQTDRTFLYVRWG